MQWSLLNIKNSDKSQNFECWYYIICVQSTTWDVKCTFMKTNKCANHKTVSQLKASVQSLFVTPALCSSISASHPARPESVHHHCDSRHAGGVCLMLSLHGRPASCHEVSLSPKPLLTRVTSCVTTDLSTNTKTKGVPVCVCVYSHWQRGFAPSRWASWLWALRSNHDNIWSKPSSPLYERQKHRNTMTWSSTLCGLTHSWGGKPAENVLILSKWVQKWEAELVLLY